MNENKKELTQDSASSICPHCKTENKLEANFCKECGTKLVEACNCWVKRTKFNCGQSKCPGFGLHEILKKKEMGR